LTTFATSEQDGMPTCVDFIRAETSPVQMVVGFRSGVSVVYDIETGKPVMWLEAPQVLLKTVRVMEINFFQVKFS
jgi:hypothetical protein